MSETQNKKLMKRYLDKLTNDWFEITDIEKEKSTIGNFFLDVDYMLEYVDYFRTPYAEYQWM